MYVLGIGLGGIYRCCFWARAGWGGGSLHSQVEHHVRDKFTTPILYGIDNFKFYDNFSLRIHNH